MHRVRGASGDVLARKPGFPLICRPRAPARPVFTLRNSTPLRARTQWVLTSTAAANQNGGFAGVARARGALSAWRAHAPLLLFYKS